MADMIFTLVFIAIFVIVGAGVTVGIILKIARLKKHTQNAQSILTRDNTVPVVFLNPVKDMVIMIDYLSRIEKGESSDNRVVLVCQNDQQNVFIEMVPNSKEMKILINPETPDAAPLTVPYSSVEKAELAYRTYSVTRSSGKSSSTSYYNQYYTRLYIQSLPMPCLELYNKTTLVSQDRGLYETEARTLGELLSKIFQCNLVRIDGSLVSYKNLDLSIREKLDQFTKHIYQFKKEIFVTEQHDDTHLICKLSYYNGGRIALAILGAIGLFIGLIILNAGFSSYLREKIFFYNPLLLMLTGSILIGFLLYMVISKSKYPVPKSIPLIGIRKVEIELISGNPNRTSQPILLDTIEEIVVRYEKSKGYTVKLVSDKVVHNLLSYSDENKSSWIRDEILSIIKSLN